MKIFNVVYYAIICAAFLLGAWFQTDTGPAVVYGALGVMGYVAYRRALDEAKDA